MKKLVLTILLISTIATLVIVGFFVSTGYSQYRKAVDAKNITDTISDIREKENYVKFDDISEYFIDAVVSVEDHRFYTHHGIDVLATVHAIYVNIRYLSFDYGASTITQQVGRLLYFTQERHVNRKIAELFVGFNLEKNYSKEDILELYVNLAYYGNGYYGIYAASHGYFDKEPIDLTFDEATYLAGLPNAPSVYSRDERLGEERRLQVVQAYEKRIEKIKKQKDAL